ncbi:hypothetical protein ACIQZN_30680 [Streptomyces sp. NPDC097595]|uniref:hypothetical protein n=1 Tax=Streptomyces sp. NPDC097595 TaxID=3366090 RepID=UPI0037F53A7B
MDHWRGSTPYGVRASRRGAGTPKLFTSTNVSNQPMQRLLQRAGWTPAGLLHGLDEDDPELFYLQKGRELR